MASSLISTEWTRVPELMKLFSVFLQQERCLGNNRFLLITNDRSQDAQKCSHHVKLRKRPHSAWPKQTKSDCSKLDKLKERFFFTAGNVVTVSYVILTVWLWELGMWASSIRCSQIPQSRAWALEPYGKGLWEDSTDTTAKYNRRARDHMTHFHIFSHYLCHTQAQ